MSQKEEVASSGHLDVPFAHSIMSMLGVWSEIYEQRDELWLG